MSAQSVIQTNNRNGGATTPTKQSAASSFMLPGKAPSQN